MELFAIVRSKLSALLNRQRLDRDLDDEIAFHLAMREQRLRNAGATDAHAASRRAFGNPALLKETTRDLWLFSWLEHLLQDVRYAARSMRKTPVLATVVVLSLTLGIGANTAIFSLVNAVMLRSLPVQRPGELVQLLMERPGRAPDASGFSNALWEATRDQQDVFSGIFAWADGRFETTQGSAAQYVQGLFISGGYFATLGLAPAAGRLISLADDKRGCAPIAVLSNGYWQSHFAAEATAIGRNITLMGQSFEIVGVAPPGFSGVEIGKRFDVAIPLCTGALFDKRNLDSRERWWLRVMGRIKPGLNPAQVRARIALLSPSIMATAVPGDWPPADKQRMLARKLVLGQAGTADSELRNAFHQPLEILMGIVGLVLLIACANIASLLLARATARGKEIAIRKAMGASRSRIVRQLLTESLLLAVAGAGLGLLLSQWASMLLMHSLTTGRTEVFVDLSLDRGVLAFTVTVAVLGALLVGLFPALRSTRIELIEAMKTRMSAGNEQRSHARPEKLIVGAQVALSLVLLVSGGLLLRTFVKLLTLDLGFDKHNLLVVTAKPQWFAADTAKVPREKRAALYEQIATRLRALPGVISVARAFTTPLGDDNWVNDIQPDVPNGPTGDAADAYFNYVSPEYFATLRMPLISGRDFSDTDTRDSAPVAIVNQTLARMFFPGVNPLGRHFRRGGYKQVWEIVGVVKDAKYESVKEETRPTAFLPVSQVPLRTGAEEFALRTLLPPSSLVRSVQQAISEVDGGIPLEFHALAEQVDDDLIRERLLATLAGFFGALALLLAMIGLYGVLSYVVTQRQVEFGIRMALGAAPASILRLVLRDVARLVIAGLSVGLAMCLPITTLMRAMLFGLQPHDTSTIVGAVLLLSSMAFVAGYLPARRATRIDPLVALRYE